MTLLHVALLAICFGVCADLSLTLHPEHIDHTGQTADEALSYLLYLYKTVELRPTEPGRHPSLLPGGGFANAAHCIAAEKGTLQYTCNASFQEPTHRRASVYFILSNQQYVQLVQLAIALVIQLSQNAVESP